MFWSSWRSRAPRARRPNPGGPLARAAARARYHDLEQVRSKSRAQDTVLGPFSEDTPARSGCCRLSAHLGVE